MRPFAFDQCLRNTDRNHHQHCTSTNLTRMRLRASGTDTIPEQTQTKPRRGRYSKRAPSCKFNCKKAGHKVSTLTVPPRRMAAASSGAVLFPFLHSSSLWKCFVSEVLQVSLGRMTEGHSVCAGTDHGLTYTKSHCLRVTNAAV